MTKFTIPIAEIAKCKDGKELTALGLKYNLSYSMASQFAKSTLDRRFKQRLKEGQK
jgi:hypothetical protein